MHAAFLGSGYEDSQVLLALEHRAGYKRSDRPDGASVLTTGGIRRAPTGSPGSEMKMVGFVLIPNISTPSQDLTTPYHCPTGSSRRRFIMVDWRFVSETSVGG